MDNLIVISINRKLAIGVGVAALVLAAFGCSYLFYDEGDSPAPESVVTVTNDKLGDLGFVKTLPIEVTGLIVISQNRKKPDDLLIRLVSVDPQTREGKQGDLCEPPAAPECDLVTSPAALVRMASSSTTTTDNPGVCYVGSTLYDCHTAGVNKGKRSWHPSTSPDNKSHYKCGGLEGCKARK